MRVAVAQLEPKLAEKERNLDACLARLEEAAGQGAELTVFPERSEEHTSELQSHA